MVVPCAIVAFCFTQIFSKIRKAANNIKNSSMNIQKASQIINLYSNTDENSKFSSQMQDLSGKNQSFVAKKAINSIQREIQITKMFAFIFLAFLFGYLPYGI